MDDIPSSVVPLSPSSSDTDAFNTANSRLHFGPIRSPEKRLLASLAASGSTNSSSPSSPPPAPLSLLPGPYATELSNSHTTNDALQDFFHPETPEIQEAIEEEISSVPAVKTIPTNPQSLDLPPTVVLLPPFAAPVSDLAMEIHSPQFTTPDGPIQPISPGADARPTTPCAQADLISFESFSTPASVFRQISPEPSTSRLQPSCNGSSIEDLLTGSPSFGGDRKGKRKAVIETVCERLGRDKCGDAAPLISKSKTSFEGSSGLETPNRFNAFLDKGQHLQTLNTRSLPSYGDSPPQKSPLTTGDGASEAAEAKKRTQNDLIENAQNEAESDDPVDAVVDCKRRRKSDRFQRELGSLSPASTQLLSHLLDSPARPSSIPAQSDTTNRIERGDQSQLTIPLFPQPSLPQTPRCSTSPIRFLSPVRSVAPQSPTKLRLQPIPLDDPNRTPARRIPIEEAIAQGRIFPSKTLELQSSGRLGPPTFRSPRLRIPANDSPARRIQTPKTSTSTDPKTRVETASRVQTTTENPGHRRARYLDNNSQTIDSKSQQDLSSNRHPVASSSATKSKHLPYPLVASRVVADGGMELVSGGSKTDSSTPSSPSKSYLKQTLSRIPRAKPYARPITKSPEKGKCVAVMRTAETGKGTSRRIMLGQARGGITSGSDDSKFEPKSSSRLPSAPTPILKRKRVEDKKPPLDKPLLYVGSSAPLKPSLSAPSNAMLQAKQSRQIRRVTDRPGVSQSTELFQGSNPEVINTERTRHESEGKEERKILDSIIPPSQITAPPSPKPGPAVPHEHFTKDAPRRTTRVRKQANVTPVTDVFGSSDGKTLPQRRRAQTVAQSDPVFFGMSAVTLKALTTSNTEKNQRYLAAKLETEVIRKEGMRPESPTVKIRTVSQRQHDERHKQRRERAVRRSRWSEDGPTADQSETDEQSDEEYSSIFGGSDFDDSLKKRHRRGPGDEEDYETPKSLGRSLRVDEEDEKAMRRVKWDRGLFTTVYLDEVELGVRRPPKENITTKGCLAATAKALTLDTLGNLPDADSPLTDVVEECVVVKKFVYDNDEEPAPPAIIVKNTRLRSRKGKNN